MRITLDHNCVIDLDNRTEAGDHLRAIVSDERHQCFVVNIGASEMIAKGVSPDHYATFEELLLSAEIAHLPRLNPLELEGITFLGHSVFARDEDEKLLSAIRRVLFGGLDDDSAKSLNRTCDVHTMWCHIHYRNDVFLTSDSNLTEQTKVPRLIALGAKRICRPSELYA